MSALSVPKTVTSRFNTIVGLTDAVCRTHLRLGLIPFIPE